MSSAIYSDNDYGEEITGFSEFTFDVKPLARVITAPIETGQQSLDNKVLDPKQITVTGYIHTEDATNAAQTLMRMYLNRKFEFYSVKVSDTEQYNNLVLKEIPHSRKAQEPDIIEYTLVYTEAMLVQANTRTWSDTEYMNTMQNGYVNPVKV